MSGFMKQTERRVTKQGAGCVRVLVRPKGPSNVACGRVGEEQEPYENNALPAAARYN